MVQKQKSDCKRKEDKSKALFERKTDWYLNNATTEFQNKDTDETTANMREEKEAGVEVNVETRTQKK